MEKQVEWQALLDGKKGKRNMSVKQRLLHIQQKIEQAKGKAGRADDIHIVAVTKYVGVQEAREVVEAGLAHLGENRWQVAKEKWHHLSELNEQQQLPSFEWHFIGSLQTNKVKEVVGKFAYIHSLDRLSLAEALQKQAEKLDCTINCFIQVNVSGEETKSGIEPSALFEFIEQIKPLTRVKPIGLMTMAPFEDNPEHTREVFKKLRLLRDQIQAETKGNSSIKELSMGMSNDYEIAVEEGATFIRLGSSLVGK